MFVSVDAADQGAGMNLASSHYAVEACGLSRQLQSAGGFGNNVSLCA